MISGPGGAPGGKDSEVGRLLGEVRGAWRGGVCGRLGANPGSRGLRGEGTGDGENRSVTCQGRQHRLQEARVQFWGK